MPCASSLYGTPPWHAALYTLSLHDALPIWSSGSSRKMFPRAFAGKDLASERSSERSASSTIIRNLSMDRSEEHTSELQSRGHLVCRLLLEKKKQSCGAGVHKVKGRSVRQHY